MGLRRQSRRSACSQLLRLSAAAGLALLGGSSLLAPSAAAATVLAPPMSGPAFFSFEAGMQGWRRRAREIDDGPVDGDWHIRRRRRLADHGVVSLELYLRNFTDAGKVWIERPFRLEPGRRYSVRLEFSFGSDAAGEIGTFEIVAGAASRPPRSSAEITRNARGSTYNGGIDGWVWLRKRYDLEVHADSRGRVWVFVGIWGTFEVTQRYLLDSVRVTLQPL